MPYPMYEEIRSRRKEKVAAFLTFDTMVAMIIPSVPAFLISQSWEILPRVLLIVACVICGYLATLEISGLPLHEHALYQTRGAIARRLRGDRIDPLALGAQSEQGEVARPLPVDSPIQPVIGDLPGPGGGR